MIRTQIKPGLVLFGILTVLTGLIYPMLITGLAQVAFPWQANGSLILQNNQVKGSALIGQEFTDPKYFWGRLSATSPYPYNAAASGGSNLSPMNPALAIEVQTRIQALKAADPGNILPIPVDLVTSSASGLDPDISLQAAYYQASRIARLRGITEGQVHQLIKDHIKDRVFGLLGEPRINVLELNLALDATH